LSRAHDDLQAKHSELAQKVQAQQEAQLAELARLESVSARVSARPSIDADTLRGLIKEQIDRGIETALTAERDRLAASLTASLAPTIKREVEQALQNKEIMETKEGVSRTSLVTKIANLETRICKAIEDSKTLGSGFTNMLTLFNDFKREVTAGVNSIVTPMGTKVNEQTIRLGQFLAKIKELEDKLAGLEESIKGPKEDAAEAFFNGLACNMNEMDRHLSGGVPFNAEY
jgi:hypothetical protein